MSELASEQVERLQADLDYAYEALASALDFLDQLCEAAAKAEEIYELVRDAKEQIDRHAE